MTQLLAVCQPSTGFTQRYIIAWRLRNVIGPLVTDLTTYCPAALRWLVQPLHLETNK